MDKTTVQQQAKVDQLSATARDVMDRMVFQHPRELAKIVTKLAMPFPPTVSEQEWFIVSLFARLGMATTSMAAIADQPEGEETEGEIGGTDV